VYVDGVTDDEAVAEIKRIARIIRRVQPNLHALQRMQERGAVLADVQNALLTASYARWQEEHGSWRITGGVDLDGDDLSVAIEFTGDLLVRTVF
jgi:hypothetical protein